LSGPLSHVWGLSFERLERHKFHRFSIRRRLSGPLVTVSSL
jgi:hypothetical protein